MDALLAEIPDFSHAEVIPYIKAVGILFISMIIYRVFFRLFNKVAETGFIHEQLRISSVFVIKWVIVIMAVLSIMGVFGLSAASLWAAFSTIFVLLAIGFVAVWSVLSNMLCSVLLVVFAPFRIGDEIEVQDAGADICVSGKVTGINLMHTTLRGHRDGEEIIIRVPNNFFFQKYVRRLPGKRTQSIKDYMAAQHEHAVSGEPDTEDKRSS